MVAASNVVELHNFAETDRITSAIMELIRYIQREPDMAKKILIVVTDDKGTQPVIWTEGVSDLEAASLASMVHQSLITSMVRTRIEVDRGVI